MFAKLKKLITISRSLFIYNDLNGTVRARFAGFERGSASAKAAAGPLCIACRRTVPASGRIYIPAASQRADAVIPASGQEYLKTKTSAQPPHGRLYGHLQLSQIAEKAGFEPAIPF